MIKIYIGAEEIKYNPEMKLKEIIKKAKKYGGLKKIRIKEEPVINGFGPCGDNDDWM